MILSLFGVLKHIELDVSIHYGYVALNIVTKQTQQNVQVHLQQQVVHVSLTATLVYCEPTSFTSYSGRA